MYKSALVGCVRLVAFLAVIATVACVDLSTAPQPAKAGKAVKDSTDVQCPSGYVVIDGIIVCRETR